MNTWAEKYQTSHMDGASVLEFTSLIDGTNL